MIKLTKLFYRVNAGAFASAFFSWAVIFIFFPRTNLDSAWTAIVIMFFLGGVIGAASSAVHHYFCDKKLKKAMDRGVYPSSGKISKEDVIRLAVGGERKLAVYAYRQLYGGTIRQAKKQIAIILKSAP